MNFPFKVRHLSPSSPTKKAEFMKVNYGGELNLVSW